MGLAHNRQVFFPQGILHRLRKKATLRHTFLDMLGAVRLRRMDTSEDRGATPVGEIADGLEGGRRRSTRSAGLLGGPPFAVRVGLAGKH